MHAIIAQILRYPVKALSGQALRRAVLQPGRPLPGDRRFALALSSTPLSGEDRWLPPDRLLTRDRFPCLARLETEFEEETGILRIRRRGRVVVAADIGTAPGRNVVSEFLANYLAGQSFGHPRLVEMPEGGGFSDDQGPPRIAILGAGTLTEWERAAGRRLMLTQLRANLLVEGLPPWWELAWVGQSLRIGAALLRVIGPLPRPTAVADPATGECGALLPPGTEQSFGHHDLGVIAEVAEGGEVLLGDPVTLDTGHRPALH